MEEPAFNYGLQPLQIEIVDDDVLIINISDEEVKYFFLLFHMNIYTSLINYLCTF